MDSFTWHDELLAFIHGCIERVGWNLMSVFGEPAFPSWTYSIGLIERFAHPELVVVGLDAEPASGLLNACGRAIAGGGRFAAGDDVEVAGTMIRFGRVHRKHWSTDLFAKWHHYYEAVGRSPEPRAALQVLWPDTAGRFPRDRGFDRRLRPFVRLLDIPSVRGVV